MNKYFILSNLCYLIEGNDEILMYDLNDKKIFSFDILNSNIIRTFEKQNDLNTIKTMYGKDNVDTLIEQLLEIKMGNYSDIQYFEEKFRVGRLKILETENPRVMNTCFIELPTNCNKNCSFCTTNKYYSCETCTIPKVISSNIDKQFYFNLLNDIILLNFQKVIFHGGDPLTNSKDLIDLFKYIRGNSKKNMSVIVKTNGDLFTDEVIDNFILYNINPIIVFDCTNKENDLLIKLEKFKDLFEKLHSNNINYFANIVINSARESNLNELYDILNEYNFFSISNSVVYDENLSSKTILKRKLNDRVLNDNFEKLKDYHPCLNGNIAITSDQKLIPCPAMHQDILVDLSKDSIFDCFEGKKNIDLYWKLSLDKINSCKKCKYRYSCSDCRALEKNISGKLYSKQLCEMISK